MQRQMQTAQEGFQNLALANSNDNTGRPSQHPGPGPLQAQSSSAGPSHMPPPAHPGSMMSSQPPQQRQPTPLGHTPQSMLARSPAPGTSSVQSTPIPQHATIKKRSNESTAAATPPAHTPAANAPTPTHNASSPQTPKSPKGKAKPKPQPKRKPSIKGVPPAASSSIQPLASDSPTPAPPSASTPAAASTPMVVATPGNAPTPVPATPASVSTPAGPGSAANTPAATPSDAPFDAGLKKRPREDEAGPSRVANGASPPKKLKTEWDGPVSDELIKKEEDLVSIKTDEDAAQFMENMSNLLKAASNDSQDSLSQVSQTLDLILKNFDGSNDLGDTSFGDLGSLRPSSPSAGGVGSALDGFEFFDFSMGAMDDEGSKAATPDLVPTTSTNPSPGSGSEADTNQHHTTATSDPLVVDPKVEDFSDLVDPLRLGAWGEIGGGESAYYQASDNWKWDSPMQTLEQPWAFQP